MTKSVNKKEKLLNLAGKWLILSFFLPEKSNTKRRSLLRGAAAKEEAGMTARPDFSSGGLGSLRCLQGKNWAWLKAWINRALPWHSVVENLGGGSQARCTALAASGPSVPCWLLSLLKGTTHPGRQSLDQEQDPLVTYQLQSSFQKRFYPLCKRERGGCRGRGREGFLYIFVSL